MKTPEEIKKGLEECTRLGGCVACPYFVDHTMAQCTPKLAADALAYIRELEAKVPKWISVEDQLPSGMDYFEDGTVEPAEYIVKAAKASMATIAMFDDKEWIPAQYNGITENRWFASRVTHWMPLPEPPEEE